MPSSSKKSASGRARSPPKRLGKGAPARPKRPSAPPKKVTPAKVAPKKAAPPPPKSKTAAKPAKTSTPAAPEPPMPEPRRGDGRRHLLSLSFLRDGDEFLARLETDAGQITELKNRSLDQLLTLVAGELEDLLE